jgi:hypothetical protein
MGKTSLLVFFVSIPEVFWRFVRLDLNEFPWKLSVEIFVHEAIVVGFGHFRFTLSETGEGIVLTIAPDSTPKSHRPAKRTYVIDFVNVAASVKGQKAFQSGHQLKITFPDGDSIAPHRIVLTSVVRISIDDRGH